MCNYKPNPMDTSDVMLSDEILKLAEDLARNTHEIWAKGRVQDGWIYGEERNDEKKHHPCLVPYEALAEEEKEYDRRTSMETLKVIIKMGFQIVPKDAE